MIWELDLWILALVVLCGASALAVKDLLSAAIIFGAYSFLMCLLWTEMGAVDVAFTEAAVGAGVSSVLFLAAVFQTSRRVKRRRAGRLASKVVGLAAALATGAVLVGAVGDFPVLADPAAPAAVHVSPYYILNTLRDTAVPNMVTSVLADYRGFDTMFETTVIFTAGLAVLLLLRSPGRGRKARPSRQSTVAGYPDTIIRFIVRQLVPFMQLFALYVVAHGHHSPGGGFQGGVILGASFILLSICFDLNLIQRMVSEKWNFLLANIGVLIYAGLGALCLLLGANFLDYGVLSRIMPGATAVTARSHGMLGIEIGVALAVMAIVVVIYVNLVSRGTYEEGL